MQYTEVKGFIIDRKVRYTGNGLTTYLAVMQPSGAFTIVEGTGQKFYGLSNSEPGTWICINGTGEGKEGRISFSDSVDISPAMVSETDGRVYVYCGLCCSAVTLTNAHCFETDTSTWNRMNAKYAKTLAAVKSGNAA